MHSTSVVPAACPTEMLAAESDGHWRQAVIPPTR